MCTYIIFMTVLFAVARERGLKNRIEAVTFAISLFILLMGVFQYL